MVPGNVVVVCGLVEVGACVVVGGCVVVTGLVVVSALVVVAATVVVSGCTQSTIAVSLMVMDAVFGFLLNVITISETSLSGFCWPPVNSSSQSTVPSSFGTSVCGLEINNNKITKYTSSLFDQLVLNYNG